MSKLQKLSFMFTIDVDWIPGSETGLVRLFEFSERYNLRTTLFITGRFAATYPEIIQEGARRGCELGTHGWEHPLAKEESFRAGTYDQQKKWMALSSEAVERASGVVPLAFRAPNLWINQTTLRVLEEMNYRFDSSVPSGRFDLGYGQVSNPRYFRAPLRPYHPSRHNWAYEGNSPILEVPPSAFFVPVNMSSLRVLGLGAVKWAVRRIAKRSPILVFYGHPAEFEVFEKQNIPADVPARYLSGLGPHNLDLLAGLVEYILSLGYSPALLSMAEPFGSLAEALVTQDATMREGKV